LVEVVEVDHVMVVALEQEDIKLVD